MHAVDCVVHSWDVARTLGAEVELGSEVLDAALEVAMQVPNDESRQAPDAAFGPAVAWSGSSRLDRLVALLGRSPDWSAA